MAKAPALDVVNTAENSATELDSKVATFVSKPYNVDISDDDDDIHEFIRRLAENLDENFGGQASSVGPLCQDLGALLLGAADDRKRARVEYRPPPSRYARTAAAETKAQRAGATDATERQYREAIRGNHKFGRASTPGWRAVFPSPPSAADRGKRVRTPPAWREVKRDAAATRKNYMRGRRKRKRLGAGTGDGNDPVKDDVQDGKAEAVAPPPSGPSSRCILPVAVVPRRQEGTPPPVETPKQERGQLARGNYRCRRCGMTKKNHSCPDVLEGAVADRGMQTEMGIGGKIELGVGVRVLSVSGIWETD